MCTGREKGKINIVGMPSCLLCLNIYAYNVIITNVIYKQCSCHRDDGHLCNKNTLPIKAKAPVTCVLVDCSQRYSAPSGRNEYNIHVIYLTHNDV